MSDHTDSPARLSDERLVAEVARLAAVERGATAELVAHLAELDSRRLYLAAGFSSLFAYCTAQLALSEHEAYNRIDAARAARRYPVILDLLRRGRVNLTTIRLLAPHLTAENHRRLLDSAASKSRLEVEELLARSFPKPDVRSTIRKLPVPAATPPAPAMPASRDGLPNARDAAPLADRADDPTLLAVPDSVAGSSASEPGVRTTPVLSRRAPAAVVPLAADRYKISFTASADTWQKLRQARELLRHRVPQGDLGEIFDQALTVLLEQLTKRKFAAVTQVRKSSPRSRRQSTAAESPSALSSVCSDATASSTGRHIPAEVRRAVWRRDEGCCAFVAHGGRRCGERGRLEFHHLQPHAADGPPSVANIALRCSAHNGHEARLYFSEIRGLAATGMPTTHAP